MVAQDAKMGEWGVCGCSDASMVERRVWLLRRKKG